MQECRFLSSTVSKSNACSSSAYNLPRLCLQISRNDETSVDIGVHSVLAALRYLELLDRTSRNFLLNLLHVYWSHQLFAEGS